MDGDGDGESEELLELTRDSVYAGCACFFFFFFFAPLAQRILSHKLIRPVSIKRSFDNLRPICSDCAFHAPKLPVIYCGASIVLP